jgi:hypothetical protein
MQESEPSTSVIEASGTRRRPTLTWIAAIMWGMGVVVFFGAIVLAAIYIAGAKGTDEYASWTLIGYPYAAAVVWIPLGLASLVLAIIALARRERGRRWAIALVAVNALALPCIVLTFRSL